MFRFERLKCKAKTEIVLSCSHSHLLECNRVQASFYDGGHQNSLSILDFGSIVCREAVLVPRATCSHSQTIECHQRSRVSDSSVPVATNACPELVSYAHPICGCPIETNCHQIEIEKTVATTAGVLCSKCQRRDKACLLELVQQRNFVVSSSFIARLLGGTLIWYIFSIHMRLCILKPIRFGMAWRAGTNKYFSELLTPQLKLLSALLRHSLLPFQDHQRCLYETKTLIPLVKDVARLRCAVADEDFATSEPIPFLFPCASSHVFNLLLKCGFPKATNRRPSAVIDLVSAEAGKRFAAGHEDDGRYFISLFYRSFLASFSPNM